MPNAEQNLGVRTSKSRFGVHQVGVARVVSGRGLSMGLDNFQEEFGEGRHG